MEPMTVEGRTYGGQSAEQRSQDRRTRLLDAARDLIADTGVAPLTVDRVCQRANLSKRYFTPSSPPRTICRRLRGGFYRRLSKASSTPSKPPP